MGEVNKIKNKRLHVGVLIKNHTSLISMQKSPYMKKANIGKTYVSLHG